MGSKFNRNDVDRLLVQCHRRCCICHRFCGTKIETDHIVPSAEGGDDEIENAICVCFECHAEIHSYNPEHPRGRKFRPEELRLHKQQWLDICKSRPETLLAATRDADVGPLQALVDELEYNHVVAKKSPYDNHGALFLDEQFRRAIREGMIAVLDGDLKAAILDAYAAMSRANQWILAEVNQDVRGRGEGIVATKAAKSVADSVPLIEAVHSRLLGFLANADVEG